MISPFHFLSSTLPMYSFACQLTASFSLLLLLCPPHIHNLFRSVSIICMYMISEMTSWYWITSLRLSISRMDIISVCHINIISGMDVISVCHIINIISRMDVISVCCINIISRMDIISVYHINIITRITPYSQPSLVAYSSLFRGPIRF